MKKYYLFLIIVLLALSPAFSQISPSFGLDVSIEDFTYPLESMYIIPHAGLNYDFNDEFFIYSIFSFPLSIDPLFEFMVNNETGLKYTYRGLYNDFYFSLFFPISIYDQQTDCFPNYVFANINIGFHLQESLNFGVILNNRLFNSDKEDEKIIFIYDFDLYLYRTTMDFWLGIFINTPVKSGLFDYMGLTVTPELRFFIEENSFLFFNVPIFGIASKYGISLGVCAGIKINFK